MQQEREKACRSSAEAHQLTGSVLKSFMSDCLDAQTTSAKKSDQDKMKTCTAQADSQMLIGGTRELFLRNCLSGS